jgi:hypothetical protein
MVNVDSSEAKTYDQASGTVLIEIHLREALTGE